MGLTKQSTGSGALQDLLRVECSPDDYVIALAGNPNTGKSTVFNSLTGLNQHTGNWPGKTVANAQGSFTHENKQYILVDLPGTYSLCANSVEEQVARDFICSSNPAATVIVTDATCLERNLNLVLQIIEITPHVIVCVNLMDEARKKKIMINLERLSELLDVPVVGTTARSGVGLEELKDSIATVVSNGSRPDSTLQTSSLQDSTLQNTIVQNSTLQNTTLQASLRATRLALESQNLDSQELQDQIVTNYITTAERIHKAVVLSELKSHNQLDRSIDNIVTSRIFGFPIMILILGVIFWITMVGAGYPSALLSDAFLYLEGKFTLFLFWLGTPAWLHDILVLGVFRTLGWVVAVMLPPMAIFFPLFTLLEDFGYLPRVAFNMDYYFKKACSHGKQALCMCMGLGCNAAGVVSCRIIDSPRERLIATITNNFMPCNGRFPALIALSSIFIAEGSGMISSIAAAIAVLSVIILGVILTLTLSKLLSKTILKGLPSSFTLELPPYRRPQIGKVILHSLFDRTLFVLGRAVLIAAPSGLIIWVMANLQIADVSLLTHCAQFLNPFAHLLGLDGYILMAFVLGFPANEIVLPILIMAYMSEGSMLELGSYNQMKELLINNGWTWSTAVSMMLFSLNHWPCATTLWTIKKETQSLKWTWVSFLVPTLTGFLLCFLVTQGIRLLELLLN